MAFPSVVSAIRHPVTTNDSTWDIGFANATILSGDLLLVIIGSDGGQSITSFSGSGPGALTWVTGQAQNGTANSICYAKAIAAGGEENTIFTANMFASEQGVALCVVIRGWEGTLGTAFGNAASAGAVETANFSSSGTAPDPPSLNPNNWDVEDTLWIAAANNDGTPTYTAKDANYTYFNEMPHTSGGAGGAGLAAAYRENAVSQENPGAYTLSATETHVSTTFAIRPAAAAGPAASDPGFKRNATDLYLPTRDFDPWSAGWRR